MQGCGAGGGESQADPRSWFLGHPRSPSSGSKSQRGSLEVAPARNDTPAVAAGGISRVLRELSSKPLDDKQRDRSADMLVERDTLFFREPANLVLRGVKAVERRKDETGDLVADAPFQERMGPREALAKALRDHLGNRHGEDLVGSASELCGRRLDLRSIPLRDVQNLGNHRGQFMLGVRDERVAESGAALDRHTGLDSTLRLLGTSPVPVRA
jgi:hypothetical protein